MSKPDVRRDFNGEARLLRIASMAAVIGVLSTGTAWLLMHAISFFTNLFFFQTFSTQPVSPFWQVWTVGKARLSVSGSGPTRSWNAW